MPRNMEFAQSAGVHNPDLAAGGARYAAMMGQQRPGRAQFEAAFAHPLMTTAVARAYHAMPSYDRSAEPAFAAMRDETNRQFDFLTGSRRTGGMGIDVNVVKHDPYSASLTEANPNAITSMFGDLQHRRSMQVLSSASTGGHPFFTDEENDRFRAVHDSFGHAATGRGFDRHGEEAAYQSHASMYSPLARQALASETRGQNSALIEGGGNGQFQEQKIGLLPQRFATPTAIQAPIGRRSASAGAGAMLQARQFHAQAFGVDL